MSRSNRLGIKGAIASLIGAGALCTGSFAQHANCPNPNGGDCFQVDPNPGCENEQCCNFVCDNDPICCILSWDQVCADAALSLCGIPLDCAPGSGPCGETNGTPGCEDPACCASVCLIDPACCIVEWDQACAHIAIDLGCADAPGCEPVGNPDVEGKGFWRNVCNGQGSSGEFANLPGYVDCVNDTATFAVVSNVTDLCARLEPQPPNNACERAEAQFMALLLNICSGRVAECNCIDDLNPGVTTVGEAVLFIDALLSNPNRTVAECKLAQAIADDINSDVSLVDCPPLPCDVVLAPLSCSDLNGDGVVDCFDLLLLLVTWGPCGDGDCPADCDNDGDVGFVDLLIMLAEWTGPLPVEVQDCVDQFGIDENLQAFIACVEAFCCP